jgi:predicted nucleic acid-binding protein
MAQPFVDTNILLRHFLQDHPDQSPRATAFIARIEHGELDVHVSDIVVFEAVFLLERHYKQPKTLVRELILGFLELSSVILRGKRRFRGVFDLYVNRNVSFADAYHAILMRQNKIGEVVSFDRDFDRVSGIRRVEP